MIARPAQLRAISPATLLLCVYVAALIVFPADFGIRLLGVVLSPARIALAVLVVFSVATRTLSLEVIRSERKSVRIGWVAFLTSALVTVLVEPSPGAVPRVLSLAAEGAVVYFATRAVARDSASMKLVVMVAILATLTVAVVSVVAGALGLRYDSVLTVLAGDPLPPSVSGERFGFIRQQASFSAALFFAIWLAAATALVLPWVLAHRRMTVAMASATWALLVGGIAVLTVSRIAVTGVFLIAGAFLWRWGYPKIASAALIVGFAVAIGFAGLSAGSSPPSPDSTSGPQPGSTAAPGGPSARVETYPSESEILAGSNDLRLRAFRATLDAVGQKPVFGWGLLRAKEVVTSIGGSANYVDSSYLVIVVEMGIVGLAAFLALIASVFAASRPAWSNAHGMALGLGWVSILVMSIVAAYLNVTQGYATFWLLAALLVNNGDRARRTTAGAAPFSMDQ
jgi:hypothetical protein